MIDAGDAQLLILYLLLSFVSLGYYPGSPCARKNGQSEPGWIVANVQVILVPIGVSVFLYPFGFWIAWVMLMHLFFAAIIAWRPWRLWAMSWLMQSAIFYGWLVLNPMRPAADVLSQ